MTSVTADSIRDAFNYLFPEEIVALRGLVHALPPFPNIVNIGAGAGTSGLLFLETREDTRVYTIDIQDESSPLGCLEGERRVIEQAGLSHFKGTRWFQIHSDSKLARSRVPDDIDLLFVDGDHTYEGALGDLAVFSPAVRPGGYIAVHDYEKERDWKFQNPGIEVTDEIRRKVIKPYPGVDRAVDFFLADSPHYRYISTERSLVVYQKVQDGN